MFMFTFLFCLCFVCLFAFDIIYSFEFFLIQVTKKFGDRRHFNGTKLAIFYKFNYNEKLNYDQITSFFVSVTRLFILNRYLPQKGYMTKF